MFKSFAFPQNSRLRTSAEFSTVQKTGDKLYAKHFLILARPGMTPNSRLGITITTKVNKRAVVRNLLKRRIRELFRIHKHNLRDIFDIVVIARKNADELTFAEIKRQILGTLKHKGYLLSAQS